MTPTTDPNDATTEADREEARAGHGADREPTAEESEAAERGRTETGADEDEVARHEKEMAEKGAHVKGEGAI
jgi:hypothetical protein